MISLARRRKLKAKDLAVSSNRAKYLAVGKREAAVSGEKRKASQP